MPIDKFKLPNYKNPRKKKDNLHDFGSGDVIQKTGRQTTNCKKLCPKHISDKGFVLKLCQRH